mgnify:CR=1 FL=1|tara:strand:+ start:2061 stop:2552 length:492 start_codon:yes stop_codon:yes gene_type:complete
MPKNFNVKSTFSFKKLANKLESIIAADLNVKGNRINKAIQDGIDNEEDIHGKKYNSYAPMQQVTKDLGGKKLLNRTGKMRKTKKIPATANTLTFTLLSTTKYGAYHNTGFSQTNKKQWFYKSVVPKREWFGIPKSMFPGQSEYKKSEPERRMRIRSAWRKFGR